MTLMEMEISYGDLYKDVYGVRPSAAHMKAIDEMSDAEFIDEFNRLDNMLWAMRTQEGE